MFAGEGVAGGGKSRMEGGGTEGRKASKRRERGVQENKMGVVVFFFRCSWGLILDRCMHGKGMHGEAKVALKGGALSMVITTAFAGPWGRSPTGEGATDR